MASEWYYTVNGQQSATPASAAQLKQMVASGQLQPTDLVWQEGMANWAPASTIKGLFTSTRSGSSAEAAPVIESPLAAKNRTRGKRTRPRDEDEEESSSGGLVGMHPLLVWLLTVCTFGLFGLIYAYLVCSAYAEQGSRRDTDSAGKPLGRVRHPLAVLLLTYLTMGFYFYYWVYQVISECGAYTGRQDVNARTEVALMLAFPPYSLYVVIFRLPELVRAVQQQAKLPESAGVNNAYIFVIPCLYPAMPLLHMVQQDALNQVWLQAP
jgi:hypothetical protein